MAGAWRRQMTFLFFCSMFEWVNRIQVDKALHFIAGWLVVAIVATIFPFVANVAVVFACIAGVVKEARDEAADGSFDWRDLLATTIGGLIGQIFIWLN